MPRPTWAEVAAYLRDTNRWKITRAGTPGAYIPGWFAMHEATGTGALLQTWDDALAFVQAQLDRTHPQEATA